MLILILCVLLKQKIKKELARHQNSKTTSSNDIDDQKLRIYRLALSCTGEYIIFAGNGTEIEQKTNVLAAMVTSINRVNEIYERDFGIRLELVANNDAVIYLNSATDLWTNEFNTTTAITLDDVIGVDNYDIGHNYNEVLVVEMLDVWVVFVLLILQAIFIKERLDGFEQSNWRSVLYRLRSS